MRDVLNSLQLALVILTGILAISSAGPASAQKRVTGAAGSSDIEQIEPILVADTYVYSVKMLCGTVLSDFSFRQFPSASKDVLMAPGTYLTAVNFHNPGDQIGVESSTVLPTGPVGFTVVGITPPNWMGHFDCDSFLTNVDYTRTPAERRSLLKTEFVEGFLVLRSPAEIAVTGVYTFKNVEAPSFVFQDAPVLPPREP